MGRNVSLGADTRQVNKVAENQVAVGRPIKAIEILSLRKQRVRLRCRVTRAWKHIQILRGLRLHCGQSFPICRERQSCVAIGVASDGLKLRSVLRKESDLRSAHIVRTFLRVQCQEPTPIWQPFEIEGGLVIKGRIPSRLASSDVKQLNASERMVRQKQ